MSQQAIDGFAAAGARWSSVFSDQMTVNMNIDFRALGSGILGSTSSTQAAYSYSSFRSALAADATSADDATALNSLGTGSSYSFQINRTTTNNAVHTASSSQVRMTNANAKALGLYTGSASASDASIAFSSSFNFDFNPNDGITAGQFDFVGIATHEIGHALGFVSGVDILDINANGFPDSAFDPYHQALDLFRYNGTNRSFTADNTAKFFSLDGGVTQLALFSNGQNFGDGNQASHWKDNLGIGIMDPTAAPGEKLAISTMDLRGFDAIGYNLSSVPEPGTLMVFGVGGAALLRRRKKK